MNGIRAKKSLGQHFLINPAIPEAIGRLLAIKPDDQLLEIGPGPGALTKVLAASRPATLLLLEKDRYWAKECAAHFPGQTILTDALTFSWERLKNQGKWKITGNLPYNIASPLIWDIISGCRVWKKCVFMTQKEVGQRLCANQETKNYSALSVWAQIFSKPKAEFYIRPGSFNPPPKVDSAVISFLPTPNEQLPSRPVALKKLLALCFQNRRKQLGGIFRRTACSSLLTGLEQLRISPILRPESLSPQQFVSLSDFMN